MRKHFSMELNTIFEVVANETNVPKDALKSRVKTRRLTDARALFFFFSLYLTSKSCTEIGRFLNRKHNTALHGAKKTMELKKFHKDFNQKWNSINNKLNPNT